MLEIIFHKITDLPFMIYINNFIYYSYSYCLLFVFLIMPFYTYNLQVHLVCQTPLQKRKATILIFFSTSASNIYFCQTYP